MKTKENPQKRPLAIREVANAIGYSYEHMRKVVTGEPVGSREMNDQICAVLGLDPNDMWQLSQREKLHRKFKDIPDVVVDTVPSELGHLWAQLNDQNREYLSRMAETLVLAQRQVDGDKAFIIK
jgi:hypothetical protein